MKKYILIVVISLFSFTVNANWWGGGNNNGWWEDNGIFGYNPYDYFDPRWYPEEMQNFIDEFDDEWGNNTYSQPYNNYRRYNNGYRNNSYNKGYNKPYNYNPYEQQRPNYNKISN